MSTQPVPIVNQVTYSPLSTSQPEPEEEVDPNWLKTWTKEELMEMQQKGPNSHPANIQVDQLNPMEAPDHPADWTIVEDNTSELPQEGEELDNTLVAEQPPSPSPSQFVTEGRNSSPPPTSVADEPVIPFVPMSRRERRIKPREIYSPG